MDFRQHSWGVLHVHTVTKDVTIGNGVMKYSNLLILGIHSTSTTRDNDKIHSSILSVVDEPNPAIIGEEAGYTLDRLAVCQD